MDNPFLAPGGAVGNVVLDLDGVVFLGPEAIEGAGDALHAIAGAGWRVLFATNNATRSLDEICERVERQTGFAPDPGLVVTSAIAAAGMIEPDDQPVLTIGEPGLRSALRDAGIRLTDVTREARAVVVALDREFTYDRLARASSAVRAGARFIATNGDVTFPTPSGQVPGAGAIVAAVEAAGGRPPEVAGKPNLPMVEAVRTRLGPGDTWMIGDRPETDLAFGVAAGWRTVLTLSGVVSDPAEVPGEWTPDLVVASLADLAQ